MYNSEQKKEFIASRSLKLSTIYKYEKVFDRCGVFEEKWEADLSTRNCDDIKYMINGMTICGADSERRFVVSVIRNYIKWCVDNKKDGAIIDGSKIKLEEINNCNNTKNMYVPSPLGLKSVLNKVFYPETDDYLDNIYRCYFWLAYMGIQKKDACLIRNENIDLDNMVIRFNDEIFHIYPESLNCIKRCMTMKECICRSRGKFFRDRCSGDILIRGTSEDINADYIDISVSRKNAKAIKDGLTNCKLSYNRIYMSGLFYEIYSREVSQEDIDFVDMGRWFVDKRFDKNTLSEKYYSHVVNVEARKIKYNYYEWKSTFYPE